MLPAPVRKYLLTSIASTPKILATLLAEISGEDAVWDKRPDPERFTLREVLAHLTDWEPIHVERINRILNEEEPVLPDLDEGQFAIDNDYAHQDPIENLRLFAERRAKLVALLKGLPEEALDRAGIRPPAIGRITIDEMATLVLAHDVYHIAQVVEWLEG